MWEAPKQGSRIAEGPSWPARSCVHGPPWDRASTWPSPSGGNPTRQETAPICTAEKMTKGLESTSPVHHTHMHTQTHAFQKRVLETPRPVLPLQPPPSPPEPFSMPNKDVLIWKAGSRAEKGRQACVCCWRSGRDMEATDGTGQAARPLSSQINA